MSKDDELLLNDMALVFESLSGLKDCPECKMPWKVCGSKFFKDEDVKSTPSATSTIPPLRSHDYKTTDGNENYDWSSDCEAPEPLTLKQRIEALRVEANFMLDSIEQLQSQV